MALAMRSSLASTQLAARKVGATRVARASVRVCARAGNWLPGSDAPAWLPDNQAGNFGFDPLGLAKEPESLKRFTEAELIHCRWAMLGVAGVLAVELLGYGNWYDAPLPVLKGAKPTYFGAELPFDLNTLTGVEFVAFAFAEGRRNENTDYATRLYPGGAFDPLGFAKDGKNLEDLKLKEIKNGRLAMIAFLGFFAQHAATGKSPIAALSQHIASPWTANFATNGVSLPGLGA